MTDRSADDFAFIKSRLKEIQDEREKAIKGTPEESAKPEDVAKNTTNTGSGGGFTTPSGSPYSPNGTGGLNQPDPYYDCGC